MKDNKITVTGDDLCDLLCSLIRERNRQRAARLRLERRFTILSNRSFHAVQMSWKLSVAHQCIALLTLPDCNMPPMEADAAYQGCLPLFELHSRSLTVRLSSKFADCACKSHNLEIAHVCYTISRLTVQSRDWNATSGFWECTTQSWDCTNSQIARNKYTW